jgi:hypothetical protein
LKQDKNVVFEITLKGADLDKTRSVLNEQSWITSINVTQSDNGAKLEINVSDVDIAEEKLLGLVQVKGVKVTDFGQKEVDLEDIFIKLVQGGN